ncbi:hypothetical protein PUR71_00585, partial [Streptomyces sp. SP17BM10]|nr:hypothetical protein [Streptomyces sp. SP17BM10]
MDPIGGFGAKAAKGSSHASIPVLTLLVVKATAVALTTSQVKTGIDAWLDPLAAFAPHPPTGSTEQMGQSVLALGSGGVT